MPTNEKFQRIMLSIVLVFIFTLIFGCGPQSNIDYEENKIFNLTGYYQRIVVDKETGVQYILLENGNRATLSVRLDANGKPMLDKNVKEKIDMEEYLEWKKQQKK